MVGYTNLQCPRARLDSTSPCPDLTSHPLLYMYWYIACARGAFVSTSHGHTEGHLTTPDPLSRGRPTPGLSTTALERPTKDNLARIAATLRVSSGAGGFVFALLDDFQSHSLAKVFFGRLTPYKAWLALCCAAHSFMAPLTFVLCRSYAVKPSRLWPFLVLGPPRGYYKDPAGQQHVGRYAYDSSRTREQDTTIQPRATRTIPTLRSLSDLLTLDTLERHQVRKPSDSITQQRHAASASFQNPPVWFAAHR